MTVSKLIAELKKLEKKHGPRTQVLIDVDATAAYKDEYQYFSIEWANVLAGITIVDADGNGGKNARTAIILNEGLGL